MLVHTATTTHLEGLERVRRRGLRVRLDRAEHAPPRARVPQEHDRARAAVPALADVRAPRLLAHGVQVQSRQALPHARVARRRRVEGRRRDAEPRRSSHGHGCSHLRSDHGSVVVVVVVARFFFPSRQCGSIGGGPLPPLHGHAAAAGGTVPPRHDVPVRGRCRLRLLFLRRRRRRRRGGFLDGREYGRRMFLAAKSVGDGGILRRRQRRRRQRRRYCRTPNRRRQLEGPHVDHDGGGGGDGDESSKMLERAHDGWVGFDGGWCRVGVGQISSMNTRGKPRRKNIWVGVSKQREEGMGLSMSTPTLRTRHHNMMGRPHRTREGVTRPRWRATSSGIFQISPGF